MCRGLNTAMAGLQGAGPLVSVDLEVLNPNSEFTPSSSEPSSSSSSSAFEQLGKPALQHCCLQNGSPRFDS